MAGSWYQVLRLLLLSFVTDSIRVMNKIIDRSFDDVYMGGNNQTRNDGKSKKIVMQSKFKSNNNNLQYRWRKKLVPKVVSN